LKQTFIYLVFYFLMCVLIISCDEELPIDVSLCTGEMSSIQQCMCRIFCVIQRSYGGMFIALLSRPSRTGKFSHHRSTRLLTKPSTALYHILPSNSLSSSLSASSRNVLGFSM
jgi:hypothetical protein